MTTRWNPMVAQRRLRAELRRLRDQAGTTQRDVAAAMDWSPSKVIRVETGAVGISSTDLWALLRHYGITDQARIDELSELAKAGRERSWWDEYRRHFSHHFINFIATEASASLVRVFQSLAIPGLLQTEEYARAIIQAFAKPDDDVQRVLQVRLERQKLLKQEHRPKMFFILDEATLRRQIGGPKVMQQQLNWLKELDQRPEISIQVITFDQGAHPGMTGSFGIYEFQAEDSHDQVVYLEQVRRNELIQNDPEEISSYLEIFYDLETIASPKGSLDLLIDQVIDQ